MKKIIAITSSLIMFAGRIMAGDLVALQVASAVNAPGNTTNTTTSELVVGYVDSVCITNSSDTAVTFTLSTPKESIITGTVTNSFVYRPRIQACGTTGALLSQYDRIFVYDKLTLSAAQSTSNQTVKCTVRIDNPSSTP